MEGHEAQRCTILGMLLENIVDDIFDSSSSDSSISDDDSSDAGSPEPADCHDENSECLPDKNHIQISKRFFFIREKYARVEAMLSSYGPEEFKKHFMISRDTFNFLLDLIEEDVMVRPTGAGGRPIPPRIQLLIALRKMCTNDSYRTICEEFGVGKTSSLRAVNRVSQALSNNSPRFIVWPQGERIEEVCQGFQAISSIPNIIGSLDSTCINIPEQVSNTDTNAIPSDPSDAQHFVQLQAVVDHEGRFTHCSVFHAGSGDKQEMFNNSAIRQYVSISSSDCPDGCYLVAGPEYDLEEHLLVPYTFSRLSEEQQCFNEHLNFAHNCVKEAFTKLKGRFATLRHKLDIFRVHTIPIFIMACCVLHNICLNRKDFLSDAFLKDVWVPDTEVRFTRREILVIPSDQTLQKRDELCRQVYLSKAEGIVYV